MSKLINDLSAELPVLIAGPTASGKSALALEIAARQGGVIVNADALQVFENWQVLTARPGADELSQAEHRLYGHVPGDHPYSVGEWLGEVRALLGGDKRPIIVGGTGLYFMALTEGLADIPATPDAVRETALARIAAEGHAALATELDAATAAAIDLANPMRVQRAWEVLTATGRGLADWQSQTPAPALTLGAAQPILIDADKGWLNDRIARRFDQMIESGALEEARANLPGWRDDLPSAKAIGAVELIVHLRGELSLPEAATRAKIATRQYAKRQRSWFRARMKDWPSLARPA